jgi:hypothetical protein
MMQRANIHSSECITSEFFSYLLDRNSTGRILLLTIEVKNQTDSSGFGSNCLL